MNSTIDDQPSISSMNSEKNGQGFDQDFQSWNFHTLKPWSSIYPGLPETNSQFAPENQWLEHEISIWDGIFQGLCWFLGGYPPWSPHPSPHPNINRPPPPRGALFPRRLRRCWWHPPAVSRVGSRARLIWENSRWSTRNGWFRCEKPMGEWIVVKVLPKFLWAIIQNWVHDSYGIFFIIPTGWMWEHCWWTNSVVIRRAIYWVWYISGDAGVESVQPSNCVRRLVCPWNISIFQHLQCEMSSLYALVKWYYDILV